MFKIEITAEENKNEQDKIVSLFIELKGIYNKIVEGEEITYTSIKTKTEEFEVPKDTLDLSEKSQLTGNYLKEQLQPIITDLKTQSNDTSLGKMHIIVK